MEILITLRGSIATGIAAFDSNGAMMFVGAPAGTDFN